MKGPLHVTDSLSNGPEQIEQASKAIGRSAIRLALFNAVYERGVHPKSATTLAQKAGMPRERVLKEIRPLVQKHLMTSSKGKADVMYAGHPAIYAHRAEIAKYAANPKALEKLPTKRRPAVSQTLGGVRIQTIVVPSKAFDVHPITIDDLDDFARVRGVKGDALLPTTVSETQFKTGIQTLLSEPGEFKDWGGEKSDLFSTRLKIAGKRYPAAFAFKGPGQPGKLTIKKMGSNGDQGPRLFQEPAEVFLVQHWREIDPSVLDLMKSLAIARSVTTGRRIYYGIIDGKDSDRIMKAYPTAF